MTRPSLWSQDGELSDPQTALDITSDDRDVSAARTGQWTPGSHCTRWMMVEVVELPQDTDSHSVSSIMVLGRWVSAHSPSLSVFTFFSFTETSLTDSAV